MVVRGTAADASWRALRSGLRAYLLYQHHHCHVTQPLLREQLLEWGIDLSVGQIDALLSDHNEPFFAEKDGLLQVGLAVSSFITVDDSGARHQGKNGYVTQIGNDLFAWFCSTESKSRINFLQLLQAGERRYCITMEALEYAREQGLPKAPLQRLERHPTQELATAEAWEKHLDTLGIATERHRRIATEGALLGGLLEQGLSTDLAIVSDGAGQFAILRHALCWVHAERLVHKLIPLNDQHRQDLARVRGEMWDLYADLKAYQRQPNPEAVTGRRCASTPCSLSGPPLRRSTRPSSACMPTNPRCSWSSSARTSLCTPMAARTTSAGMSNGARSAAERAATWGDAVAIALPA